MAPRLCIFPARALEEESLTDADLRVLAAIGIYTDREGSGCFANVATLMKRARIKARSTWFDSTKRLLAAGLIERESGQLQGRSSNYSVVLESKGGVRPAGHLESGQPDTGVHPEPDTPTINAPINAPSSSMAFLEPGYLDDWLILAGKIDEAGGEIRSWRAECNSALQGMHLPRKATPAEISQAIRHFAGNGADLSLRLFTGYLRSVVAPRPETAGNGQPAGKKGPSKPAWLLQKEQADQDEYLNKDPNTKLVVDAAIATKGERWWAKMKREAKAQDRFVYPYAFLTLKTEDGL